MPRSVDEAALNAAIAAVDSGMSQRDAANLHGVTTTTLFRRLHDRRANISTKQAILGALSHVAAPVELSQLESMVGMGRHELVHLLWSMQKQGWVTFATRTRGRVPVRIAATNEGRAAHLDQLAAARGTDEETGPMVDLSETTVAPTAPEAQDPTAVIDRQTFPILSGLMLRRRALERAWEVLAGVDGLEDVATLVGEAFDGVTPVELEYLRFAESRDA